MKDKIVGILVVTLMTFAIFLIVGCSNPVKTVEKPKVCVTDTCVEGIDHDEP
jgi:hypothetical protein